MEPETLFISDLHLSIEKPEITRRFVNFLDRRARKAQAFYILGDWIGGRHFAPALALPHGGKMC